MKERSRHQLSASNLIRVNFPGKSLSIDNDDYLDRVTEIHCRGCNRRRPRRGAIELEESWGYLCEICQEKFPLNKRRPLHEDGPPVEPGTANRAG